MDLGYRLLIGISFIKSFKNTKVPYEESTTSRPSDRVYPPLIEFNDLPAPLIKARLTSLLSPIPRPSICSLPIETKISSKVIDKTKNKEGKGGN